jgi:hypothetical protein
VKTEISLRCSCLELNPGRSARSLVIVQSEVHRLGCEGVHWVQLARDPPPPFVLRHIFRSVFCFQTVLIQSHFQRSKAKLCVVVNLSLDTNGT